MSEGSHLSIGEVLALLLEEFPDVTISKIRFLESQGLIDPERTPSGYRKFFDPDVERLRMILREQRENYLPLRVIKDRIDSGTLETADSAGAARHPQRRSRRAKNGSLLMPGRRWHSPVPTSSDDLAADEDSGDRRARHQRRGPRARRAVRRRQRQRVERRRRAMSLALRRASHRNVPGGRRPRRRWERPTRPPPNFSLE